MIYEVYITAAAERDILRATDHIEFVLKNPKAADDLLDEAEAQINALAEFPNKFKLVDDPVLASWGIHFVIVNGYLAFYVISEEIHRVTVVRFLFQKSNWSTILGHGFSLL
ncbi:type II toxin-antitoxin system RelE/ParE family toxin [Acetobacterium wieringae]|uniref:Plasmid stabilization system protein n=1 Tax=Acetobacterium wieringae TaxID=52694 RepID=A0A1F2PDH6_9FIRM|nr:type II toxin-antitoxin system RelE/ParE family toxin [Acetobacterium wieringae]OFV69054.1 plasmid stabilization system protein [Acetobacterium wieringae]TYC85208.1 type II toxin-antitoxin system RelE/ParE family toxin [Acetobacterium wieringae]